MEGKTSFQQREDSEMSEENKNQDNNLLQSVILPQQPDTVTMAILCSMKYLPPNATVRDCLEKYREIKLKEIDEIHQTISNAFT